MRRSAAMSSSLSSSKPRAASTRAGVGGSTATSSSSSSSSYTNPPAIKKVVDHLKDTVGINFLALDFDQTILDIHTGGNWKGSLEELFPHVRPVYAQLITAALTSGLEVAVVTFSCQTRFVRGVLDHVLASSSVPKNVLESIGVVFSFAGNNNNNNNNNHAVDTSHKIPIRGGDRSWRYNGSGSIEGKQPHMASAVEELEARRESDYERAKQAEAAASSKLSSSLPKTPPPPPPSNSSNGKEASASSSGAAATAPQTKIDPPEAITRKTTLLLDDDARNIQHALNNKVRAIWFNPKKPNKLLPELLKLE